MVVVVVWMVCVGFGPTPTVVQGTLRSQSQVCLLLSKTSWFGQMNRYMIPFPLHRKYCLPPVSGSHTLVPGAAMSHGWKLEPGTTSPSTKSPHSTAVISMVNTRAQRCDSHKINDFDVQCDSSPKARRSATLSNDELAFRPQEHLAGDVKQGSAPTNRVSVRITPAGMLSVRGPQAARPWTRARSVLSAMLLLTEVAAVYCKATIGTYASFMGHVLLIIPLPAKFLLRRLFSSPFLLQLLSIHRLYRRLSLLAICPL